MRRQRLCPVDRYLPVASSATAIESCREVARHAKVGNPSLMRMIPKLHSRVFLQGTFVVDTPVHTGCWNELADYELTLNRCGDGRWCVSGADLARRLRQWLQFAVIGSAVRWSHRYSKLPPEQPLASFLEVEDLLIEKQANLFWEDAAGDDEPGRHDGYAWPNRGILPRGTKMAFCLVVRTPDAQQRDAVVEELTLLKRALEKGLIRLGTLTHRDLGRVHLENGRVYEQCFASRSGILAVLRNRRGHPVRLKRTPAVTKSRVPVARAARLTFLIEWQPIEPLRVQGVLTHPSTDNCPVCSGSTPQVVFVLPGRTIRNALRRRAVQILRTMVPRDALGRHATAGAQKLSGLSDIWAGIDAVFGPVRQLFDSEAPAEPKTKKKAARHAARRTSQTAALKGQGAALKVWDCHALASHAGAAPLQHLSDAETPTTLVSFQASNAAQSASTHATRQDIAPWLRSVSDDPNCRVLHTFSDPDQVRWEPLRWELNLAATATKSHQIVLPATALLLLLLQELGRGRIRLGLVTGQGMGAVRIDSVHVCGEHLPRPLQPLVDVMLPGGSLDSLPSLLREQLTVAWLQWLYGGEEGSY